MKEQMLTSPAKMSTPEITATTIPATTPASRPLLEIPVPVFGGSVTPVKESKEIEDSIKVNDICNVISKVNIISLEVKCTEGIT